VINDKTIAYLLKRRREEMRAGIERFRFDAQIFGYLPDDVEYIARLCSTIHRVTKDADKKLPLPEGITDEDYDKYQPFMMNSYECGYIGKDGNITDEGMFDLEDD